MFDEAPKAIGIIDFDSLIPLSNPWACNFAIIRSCGKQSNALDKSVSNAAYSPPWSSDFLIFLSLPRDNFAD